MLREQPPVSQPDGPKGFLLAAAGRHMIRCLRGVPSAARMPSAERRETTVNVGNRRLFALRHPYVANSRWFEDVAGREIAAAGSLTPDVVTHTHERGRARDL
jgi:hypothetical protein